MLLLGAALQYGLWRLAGLIESRLLESLVCPGICVISTLCTRDFAVFHTLQAVSLALGFIQSRLMQLLDKKTVLLPLVDQINLRTGVLFWLRVANQMPCDLVVYLSIMKFLISSILLLVKLSEIVSRMLINLL